MVTAEMARRNTSPLGRMGWLVVLAAAGVWLVSGEKSHQPAGSTSGPTSSTGIVEVRTKPTTDAAGGAAVVADLNADTPSPSAKVPDQNTILRAPEAATGSSAATSVQALPSSMVVKTVRLRSSGSTEAPAIGTIQAGTAVNVLFSQGQWVKIAIPGGMQRGWVFKDYLSDGTGAVVTRQISPSVPVTETAKTAPPAIQARKQPEHSPGDPIREPRTGSCDCPYDYAKNGSICGGRSAYSRPGGREPVCYYK